MFQLENSALFAGIALRKDQHDDLLDWPFTKSITFQLVNEDPEKHFDQGFRCSKADENIADCLGCPSSGSHPPIGLRDFISVEHLNNGFIVADMLHVRILVIPEEYKMPSCGLLSIYHNIIPFFQHVFFPFQLSNLYNNIGNASCILSVQHYFHTKYLKSNPVF